MGVKYKTIEGFSDYKVSSNGKIYSYRTSNRKQIKGHIDNQGYQVVGLIGDDGKHHTLSVHRIVATAFCEKPIGYDEVHHLNEIRFDNRAENLIWVHPSLHKKIHYDKL